MFTGLVEKLSKVEKITLNSDGAKIYFKADFDDVKKGDSIALNGACLSVVSIEGDIFCANIMRETLNLTNLKTLKKGDEINLERAMKLTQRLDGHIVLGHIDEVVEVKNITRDGFSKRISFNSKSDLVVKKGSIALNGVSLTVSRVYDDGFEVSLIPLTLQDTNLKNLKIGDIVNVEYDYLAKYVKKFSQNRFETKLTEQFLKDNGF